MNLLIVILACIQVESGGNTEAWNAREEAFGCLQIRQACITDLNSRYGTNYKLKDFKSKSLSKWAFIHYGRMYGAVTPEQYARIWNGGPKGMSKKSTLKYWQKVKNKLKEQNETPTSPPGHTQKDNGTQSLYGRKYRKRNHSRTASRIQA